MEITLNDYKQLDQIFLDETNVKKRTRVLGKTEKGELRIEFDGEYTFYLGGKDVTSPALLSLIPKLLYDASNNSNNKTSQTK